MNFFPTDFPSNLNVLKHIITFDRSSDKFVTDPEKNPQAQIKGRARVITYSSLVTIIGSVMTVMGGFMCLQHPGAVNYFFTSVTALATLLILKETIVQGFARKKEKEKFHIQEETAETRFSYREFVTEFDDAFQNAMEGFTKQIKHIFHRQND